MGEIKKIFFYKRNVWEEKINIKIFKKLLEKTDKNRSILLTKFVEDFLRFSFLVEEIRKL